MAEQGNAQELLLTLSAHTKADAVWAEKGFEVAFEHTGKTIVLVVDPQTQRPVKVESNRGKDLGGITLLDAVANNLRQRHRAKPDTTSDTCDDGLAERIHEQHNRALQSTFNPEKK